MATTITPNRRSDQSEVEDWPTLDRDPALLMSDHTAMQGTPAITRSV